MSFLDTFFEMLVILFGIAAGYLANRLGYLGGETDQKISKIIRSRGFRTGREHYIQTLAQSLALFAMAFYGKTIVYRTTDFKSNEYPYRPNTAGAPQMQT